MTNVHGSSASGQLDDEPVTVSDQVRAVIDLLKQTAQSTDALRAGEDDGISAVASDRPATNAPELDGDVWLDHPSPTPRSQLGQLLIERGLVSDDHLVRALEQQRSTGCRLGEVLVEIGAISGFDLAKALADHLGVPFVDLRTRPPDLVLSALIPEHLARRYCALPVARWSGHLVVAMANPNDVFALDDVRVVAGQPVIAALAEREDLQESLDRAYQHAQVESTLDDATTDVEKEDEALAALDAVDDGPVVRLVHALLEQAASDRASDIHIEPTQDAVIIRQRVDGVLRDTSEAPLSVLRALISRIKVLSGLDIAQRRIPQDGRFSISVHGRAIDVRVATVPTATGEAMVLRLLDPSRGVMDLSGLGFTGVERARFERAFRAPQGTIFVTGPTGSGKTSTLYAILSEISTRDKSIVAVEDPVEYRLFGVKQIQVHPRSGLTFPVALRSVLRVDPDVIFVGEVRDGETARIAADAAITGHLVFSTLHTTRAAATPMRLVDMGLEPYLVASALSCVVAQRLVRSLCDQCARPVDSVEAEKMLRDLAATDDLLADPVVRAPVGCPSCRHTGYSGRSALYEIMPVTDGIARLIVDRAATIDIERLAVEEGMDTLRIAALKRVARGDLSIDEMSRVIY